MQTLNPFQRIDKLEKRVLGLSNQLQSFIRKSENPAKFKIGDLVGDPSFNHKVVQVEWVLRSTYEGGEHYDWQYTYSTPKGLLTFWHSPDYL